jgi:hypothetical protein
MIGSRSNAPVEYISTGDAALDHTSPGFDFRKFMETFDRAYLPVKAGRSPTVFTVRRLSRRRFTAISGMAKHEQPAACVAYGVTGISNYMDGRNTIVPEFDGAGADSRLAETTLDAIFSPSLFAELAQVIVLLTELDPLADGRSG